MTDTSNSEGTPLKKDSLAEENMEEDIIPYKPVICISEASMRHIKSWVTTKGYNRIHGISLLTDKFYHHHNIPSYINDLDMTWIIMCLDNSMEAYSPGCEQSYVLFHPIYNSYEDNCNIEILISAHDSIEITSYLGMAFFLNSVAGMRIEDLEFPNIDIHDMILSSTNMLNTISSIRSSLYKRSLQIT